MVAEAVSATGVEGLSLLLTLLKAAIADLAVRGWWSPDQFLINNKRRAKAVGVAVPVTGSMVVAAKAAADVVGSRLLLSLLLLLSLPPWLALPQGSYFSRCYCALGAVLRL